MNPLMMMQMSQPQAQNQFMQQAQQQAPTYMNDFRQAQQYDQLANAMMGQAQRGGTTVYDALAAIVNGYSGAKARKNAENSWADAYKGQFEYENSQRMAQQMQAQQAKQDEMRQAAIEHNRVQQAKIEAEERTNAEWSRRFGMQSDLAQQNRESDFNEKLALMEYGAELKGQAQSNKPVKMSGEQAKASGFYDRMVSAQGEIDKLGDFDSSSTWERVKAISNYTASTEYQQYRQAADDWIRAKLRKESGAVIGEEEMAKEYEVYFPQRGDSKEVIEQKKRARSVAENAMLQASGRQPAQPAQQPQESTIGRFRIVGVN